MSRLYWACKLAFEVTGDHLTKLTAADYAVEVVTPKPSFPRSMYPLKVSEAIAAIDPSISRLRLRLLVTCCANLESYLKDITFLHLAAKGHTSDFLTLDAVGSALGAPILGRSSLIEPLIYAEQLLGVSFGVSLTRWKHFYKLRGAAAHSGGFVTPRTLRDIPGLALPLHSPIELSYQQLFEAMEAADKIVEIIDRKVVSHELKRMEIARELAFLREANRLPPKKDVLAFIHKEFGYPRVGKIIGKFVYAEFY